MNINTSTFNIIKNGSYILIPIVVIYLFKRIIECFQGETESRMKELVLDPGLNDVPLTQLKERKVWKMDDIPPFEIKDNRIVFDASKPVLEKREQTTHENFDDRMEQALQVAKDQNLKIQFVISQDLDSQIENDIYVIEHADEEFLRLIEEVTLTRGCKLGTLMEKALRELGKKCPNLVSLYCDNNYEFTVLPDELDKLKSISFGDIVGGSVVIQKKECLTSLTFGNIMSNQAIVLRGFDNLEYLAFGKIFYEKNVVLFGDFPKLKRIDYNENDIYCQMLLADLKKLKDKIDARNESKKEI